MWCQNSCHGARALRDVEVEVYLGAELLTPMLTDIYLVDAAGNNQALLPTRPAQRADRTEVNNAGVLAHLRAICEASTIPALDNGQNAVQAANATQADWMRGMEANRGMEGIQARTQSILCSSLILVITTFTKQGTSSSNWCRSRARQIERELQVELELTPALVRDLWDRFARHITGTEQEFTALFDNLRQNFNHSQRVQVTLDQAQFTGLTSLSLINRCIEELPECRIADFAMEAGEANAIAEALELVDGRPYISFSMNAAGRARVKSTRYRNTGYYAFNLLQRVLGETSLSAYGGIENFTNLRFKIMADQWVDQYIAARAAGVPQMPQGAAPAPPQLPAAFVHIAMG